MHELPRILMLERDALVASHLAISLEKAGADVITADHAVEALQRLAQFTFSGAVIDYWPGARRSRAWSRSASSSWVCRSSCTPWSSRRARGARPVLPIQTGSSAAVMRLIQTPWNALTAPLPLASCLRSRRPGAHDCARLVYPFAPIPNRAKQLLALFFVESRPSSALLGIGHVEDRCVIGS